MASEESGQMAANGRAPARGEAQRGDAEAQTEGRHLDARVAGLVRKRMTLDEVLQQSRGYLAQTVSACVAEVVASTGDRLSVTAERDLVTRVLNRWLAEARENAVG